MIKNTETTIKSCLKPKINTFRYSGSVILVKIDNQFSPKSWISFTYHEPWLHGPTIGDVAFAASVELSLGLHRMNIDSEIEIDAETEIEIETEFVEIDCIVYGWAKETAKRWTGCFHWRKTRTKPRQPAMSEGKRIIENYRSASHWEPSKI